MVTIALILIAIDLVQFIGWVALPCIHTKVVLKGIINKLQCSVLCVKRTMSRVPIYATTSILTLK